MVAGRLGREGFGIQLPVTGVSARILAGGRVNEGANQGRLIRTLPLWRLPHEHSMQHGRRNNTDTKSASLSDARRGSQEVEGVEVVDVNDAQPRQGHLEGVYVVLEVNDLEALFLQLMQT